VKRIRRIALLFAGALIALVATVLLGLNLYVQSQGTQARIQAELSERLGTTLRIQRISVTPWWGLKLSGITMPQDEGSVPGDFLQADTFRLRIRVASLFSSRLVIKEISLINPTVVWAQNADGKWRLPASLPVAEPDAATAEQVAPVAPPSDNVPTTDPSAATGAPDVSPATDSESAQAARFTPEIRRVNLKNGNFHFLDAKGKPVATFEGVRFRSNVRRATAVRGDASIAKTSLRNRFFLEELQSPLKYDPEELDFSEISARAAGGEITGRFTMRPAEADSPFKAVVRFRQLQADRIVTEAGGPAGMVQGRLEGNLDASGETADPNALAGSGEIFLHEGEVRRYSLLVALGQLLHIDELTQLRLDQAHVKYHINPGVVTIDELLLTSPNIRLSETGTVSFAAKLRLESQLAINERIHGQLFRLVRENFQPIAEPGYTAVQFQITGTVERPKTNLMSKLVGRDLKDLGGVIDSLFGGKSDRSKKKKKSAEELPPAPPAAVVPGAVEPAPLAEPAPPVAPAEAPQTTGSP
jgi:hypothetical protein